MLRWDTWVTCVVAIVTMRALAAAEPAKLAAARDAVAAVDYHAARDLLESALEGGESSPADLAEIYRLSAYTAVVLGERTLADTYFRSWLSLDPNAALPLDAAAKFREPFIDAQAYVRERGALRVTIGTRAGRDVVVMIAGDPIQLARSVSLADDPTARVQLGRDKRALLRAPAGKAMVRVHVYDQFGNRVFERSFATLSAIPAEAQPNTTPLVRRWQLWTIPAVGLAAGAYYFQHEASAAQDELDRYAGTRGDVFYDQVADVLDRRDRQHHAAIGLAIGAGACAIVATLAYVTSPRERKVMISPAASPSGGGVAVIGRF